MAITYYNIDYILKYKVSLYIVEVNKMAQNYIVKRKLQEQSGSYFVILPKLWVEYSKLKQGDLLSVKFNEKITITRLKKEGEQ